MAFYLRMTMLEVDQLHASARRYVNRWRVDVRITPLVDELDRVVTELERVAN
jgi:hypothetical protein